MNGSPNFDKLVVPGCSGNRWLLAAALTRGERNGIVPRPQAACAIAAQTEALPAQVSCGATSDVRVPKAIIAPHAGYRYSGGWPQPLMLISRHGTGYPAPGRAAGPGASRAAARTGCLQRRRVHHTSRQRARGAGRLETMAWLCRRCASGTRLTPRNIVWKCSYHSCSACCRTWRLCRCSSARPVRKTSPGCWRSLWDGPDTAVIVSSDLSHFHDYADSSEAWTSHGAGHRHARQHGAWIMAAPVATCHQRSAAVARRHG